MPYEHEAVPTPRPPPWTQHPLYRDLMSDAAILFGLLTLMSVGAPVWMLVAAGALLLASFVATAVRETGRRHGRHGE